MATLKEVQDKLRPHGIVVKKTGYGNEHRVNYHKGDERTAYYTDDREDAHATGMKMAESKDPYYKDQKKNKS